MLSAVVVSFLVGVSVTAWSFARANRSTGGNTQTAITAAAVAGGLAFLATLIMLNILDY